MLFLVEIIVAVVSAFACILLSSFILFEEDSVFDLTDFNVSHLILLLFSALSVIADNNARAN